MRKISNVASDAAEMVEEDATIWDAEFRDSKQRIVAAPDLGAAPVADTHCHLDMLPHPDLAIARAAAHGIGFLVSVVDPTEDPAYTYDGLAAWLQQAEGLLAEWGAATKSAAAGLPRTRIIIGCHPHNAAKYDADVESELIHRMSDSQTAAIGEIGLDYHYDASPRPVQREVFRRQLALAQEHGLPVALHLREAHDDGYAILEQEGWPAAGVLLHCYTLGPNELLPFLERGAQVAFGGTLTFKKADDLRQAAQSVAAGRIMTETDAPFMTPEPLRGTLCGPEHTAFTAARLAEVCCGDDAAGRPAFLATVYANALRFFDR